MEKIVAKYQKKDEISDSLLDLLIMAYVYGVENVNESLGIDTLPTKEGMYNSIFKKIDGKTWEERLKKVESAEEVRRIAETESHRVFGDGQWDTAKGRAKSKTWHTMLDDKVREEHWYLDGLTIGVNDMFYTLDGYGTLYPGNFGVASLDVNCRCYLEYGG